MTNEEAYKILMSDADFDFGKASEKSKQTADALCVAVKALKKQMPKKPNVYADRFVHCPNCDEEIGYKWKKYPTEKNDFGWLKHCWKCGQAIDWEEDEQDSENNTEFVLPDDSWDEVKGGE